MPGVNDYLEAGPDSWEVSANVLGGQLVMIDPTDPKKEKVIPTDGATKVCLGQATIDAIPRAEMGTNMAALRHATSVRYAPHDSWFKYMSSAGVGQLLVAASLGRVQPYVEGTHTPDQIVARCTNPGGVTAGSVGRARILL